MLNLDFLGEEDSDDQTVQTTNTNDYDGMDQMQQTMNEMLALAKKSGGGGMLDASHKSSGSLHSLGNISFGVSSVLNHKERLYGSKRNVTENQQVMQGGKMDSGEFELKKSSSVTPLHLKNENNGIAHLQQALPPSLPPRLSSSSSNNHPQHRPTITTSNTSNSSTGDDQDEEYSAGEIDAIIALKLEVANQRTTIDELSSKLNRALGEKKELEEKMVMSSSMNSRSSHWRRLNRDHHDGEQHQPSIDEEPNVLSSSLRQLSMSYKTATSTIFSSFSVANPLKEEITPPPSSAQPTPRTTTATPTTAQSSPISTSWSQAKSGSTTLISTPSQQQQQQQQRSQSLTIPNNSKDNSKIQLQLLELQTTLATQMESSKRKEREWMSLCEKLQSENQRLSDENRQWKKNSVGSCSNLSGLSRLSGRNGASGSSSGGGGSIRSLQSSDFSSRKGRITEGVPLREEKKQDSVAEGKEEEEEDDDECSSTQNSTGDQESWKKSLEVEPIFVRTKI